MTKLFIRTAFTAMVCGSLAAPAFAQQVSVTLNDGLVTIKAENATIRQILDEWARVGQAKIVNADKLAGTPQTLTLVNVPERQALDTILRGTSGYLAIDRTTPVANASAYERIMVMNKTTQAVTVASAGSTTPTYTPPMSSDNAPGGGDPDNPVYTPNVGDPPAPNAPVANPYAAQGANGVGMATGGAGSAYNNGAVNGAQGGNAQNGSTVTANPADVKFDYANPVPYFEAQRQLQQQQQQTQPQQTQPTATPGGTQLLAQPGVAPAPTPNTSTPTTGTNTFNPYNPPANFNPYNLKPGETIPGTTPQQNVTPDRSKYANPYQPQP
jgi:hypothetical protein